MAFLHRLRLRLGLFRWQNYATIGMVYPTEAQMEFMNSWGGFTVTHWVLWYEVFWLPDHRRSGGKFIGWAEAVKYIRSCVRQGVRP